MLPILIALAFANGSPAKSEADFSMRIRESSAAAETLQGPLDGRWILYAQGRPAFVFQIVDPADGGPLQAAWSDPDGRSAPRMGIVNEIVRDGRNLRLAFTLPGDARATVIQLRYQDRLGWSDEIANGARGAAAELRRR